MTVFFGLFFLDRITKLWAIVVLSNGPIKVIDGLRFSLTWNRGVSWGLFDNASHMVFYILTAFILSVIVSFVIYTVIEYRSGKNILFELVVLSGALSNFVDRIYYKAVIDFIDFYIYSWHWPTFNIADVCIVIGIGGMLGRGLLCMLLKD